MVSDISIKISTFVALNNKSQMKKLAFVLFACVGLMIFASCSHSESYADEVKNERADISQYISKAKIKVISESEFYAQDSTTDTTKNEYVLFSKTGVYMQIIRKGEGQKIRNGETTDVICRYSEWNLSTDSLQSSNNIQYYTSVPDIMSVTKSSGTYTASFTSTNGVMYKMYSSLSVPKGWLAPLDFINIGRSISEDGDLAKVKLIVPHSQGQAYASEYVYPCLYEITYERGR